MSASLFLSETLRDSIRSSAVLRAVRPYAFGGHPVRRNTKICIEGAARSGNTFTFLAAQAAWPELQIAHHTHCLSNIRRAIAAGIPVIVLIRDPAQCVPSSVLRQDMLFGDNTKRHLMRALVRYLRIYSYAEAHAGQVTLIDFPAIPTQPEAVLNTVADRLGPAHQLDPAIIPDILARAKQAGDRLAQVKFDPAKAHLGSWMPSDDRKEAAQKALSLLQETYPDHLARAQDLYQRCTSHCALP